MAYVHRYWLCSDTDPELPPPPRGLRPSSLNGPVRGGWWCLDVSRLAGLNEAYAAEMSRINGVKRVVAFLEQTTESVEDCLIFRNGVGETLIKAEGRHPTRKAVEQLLEFDPWEHPLPVVRTYTDASRRVAAWGLMVAWGLAVAAKLATEDGLSVASFLVGLAGWSILLWHKSPTSRFGGAFVGTVVLMVAGGLCARLLALL